MVSIMSHNCIKTYTKRHEADDAVDGRVRAFPDRRQANYPQTMQITPNYVELPTHMEAKYLQVTYMGCMIQWCRSMDIVCLIESSGVCALVAHDHKHEHDLRVQ